MEHKRFLKPRRNFKTPVHLVCKNDDLRPAFELIYFKDGFLYATDAHIGIKQSLKEIHEFDDSDIQNCDGKYIHFQTFAQLYKQREIYFEPDGIVSKSNRGDIVYKYAAHDGKFPDISNVILVAANSESKSLEQFNVCNKLFDRLIRAMRGEHFTPVMQFKGNTGLTILINDKQNEGDNVGILMQKTN